MTDSARRPFSSGGGPGRYNRSSSSGSTGGPFTPFTDPARRSANGKPPPRKRPGADPRGFNIKDTPDDTSPFVGSQVYVDQGAAGYAPPLQVEPPPRDPTKSGPAGRRPFEPAPFSSPQPHAVRTEPGTGRGRSPADEAAHQARQRRSYNQGGYGGGGRGSQRQRWARTGPFSSDPTAARGPGGSPWDGFRDASSGRGGGVGGGGGKRKQVEVDGPSGFKSGNVEVFTSPDGGERPRGGGIKNGVVVIDAEVESGEDDGAGQAAGAGAGREPFSGDGTRPGNGSGGTMSDAECAAALARARSLLGSDPKLRYMASIARSNPRVREAVEECADDPAGFGRYLEDAEIGPILTKLRSFI